MWESLTAPERITDDLALKIECPRLAEAITVEVTKIRGRAVSPQIGIISLSWKSGSADNLSCIVDGIGRLGYGPGGAGIEVGKRSSIPKERMAVGVVGEFEYAARPWV